MDNKALYNLSYGVFLLGAKDGEKVNACITNTCIQVASEPVRLAISCMNRNKTCDMIKASSLFTLSVLDKTCTFDTIKHFGMQSGRDVDKFADFKATFDNRGIPYLEKETCAVILCRVVDKKDLGSHTLFIAEIDDAFCRSQNPPLTYAMYQAEVKPKPQGTADNRKIKGWRCKICGYVYEGSELPKDFTCPLCGHDASDFEAIYE